ncbi:hypothetical protein DPMN_064162 [Dreissena polymorpha]|uniref:Uncharacterized protein n=1 Tax=Dreissena polymorpha TaxID=45954 RepID=A0A9D4CD41_DREPO|nr:hypothetical protein DPMN_064162 [Dreissena polymorpha]
MIQASMPSSFLVLAYEPNPPQTRHTGRVLNQKALLFKVRGGDGWWIMLSIDQ